VTAMEARLLPMVTWYWTYAANDYRTAPPSPHTMRDRRLQIIVLAGWTIGVPVLATGMFLESADLVRVGASALLTGVMTAIVDNAFVVMQGLPEQTPAQSSLLRSHHNGHEGHKVLKMKALEIGPNDVQARG